MDWLILITGAFLAGLVDAVVGGGGLIQLPLLLAVHPGIAMPILFATNKISSIGGTAVAAWEYSRKIHIPYFLILPAVVMALVGAAAGAALVSWVPSKLVRPVVLVLLIAVGAYTFFKPNFGSVRSIQPSGVKGKYMSGLTGLGLGFYDGAFGPGTGSFLIFIFVRYFGMDLLNASAASKLVNIATNLAAIGFFLTHRGAIWSLALGMGAANIIGAQFGIRLALAKGNSFIRYLLLVVLSVLVVKLGRDSVLDF